MSFNAFCEALLLIVGKTGGAGQSGAVYESEKTGTASQSGKLGGAGDNLIALELLLNHCEKETVKR